jgi:hypothetical protein
MCFDISPCIVLFPTFYFSFLASLGNLILEYLLRAGPDTLRVALVKSEKAG